MTCGAMLDNLAGDMATGLDHEDLLGLPLAMSNDTRRAAFVAARNRPGFRSSDATERFWGKVDIGAEGECWEWQAYTSSTRYGEFYYLGKKEGAHRVAWMLTYGAIPPDADVCHHCDNPSCVNPTHLFVGTRLDNAADAVSKGRIRRGSASPQARLTESEVREIRRRYKAESVYQHELAAEYGVSRGTIASITQRKSWGWLDDLDEED